MSQQVRVLDSAAVSTLLALTLARRPAERPFSVAIAAGAVQQGTMAEEEAPFQPRAVKDVPAEQFIEAYAAHLKTNDKVRERPGAAAEAAGL